MNKKHQEIANNGFRKDYPSDSTEFVMLSTNGKSLSNPKQRAKFSFGLGAKVTLYSVVLSLIPVFVVGVSIYGMIDQSLKREMTLGKQLQADALASDMHEFLLNRQHELELLANREFINVANNQTNGIDEQSELKAWSEQTKIYTNLAVFDLNGNVLLKNTAEPIVNQGEADYFQAVRQSKKLAISQPMQGNNATTNQIYLAVPVKDRASGEVIKIIRAIMPASILTQAMDQKQLVGNKYYLLDSSGNVFLTNDINQQGKSIEQIFLNWNNLHQSGQMTTRILTESANENQALVTVLPKAIQADLGWKFVLSQDADTTLAVPKDLLGKLLLSLLLTILVVAMLATFVVSRVLARLTTAKIAVKNLAQGNLDTRMSLQGQDEITSLGANINEMAAQLQQLIQERTTESEKIKQFAQALLTIRQASSREALLTETAQEIMTSLGVERVTIYACNPDGSYDVLAESCLTGIKSLRQVQVSKDISSNTRVFAVSDITQAGYGSDLVQQLQQIQVKARAIAPIHEDKQVTDAKRNRYTISALGAVPVAIAVDMCTTERDWLTIEVDFIRQAAAQLGLALERIDSQNATQALKNLAVHLSGSWHSNDIYGLAVQDIRQALNADRVVIYQFDETYRGIFLAESVVGGVPCVTGVKLTDSCLEEYVEKYRRGRVVAIHNIYDANLSQCYIQQLETFAVKANLVAPILVGDELLGLLIAHQCTQPRIWQIGEIDLFEQFARMVGLALERVSLLQTTTNARDIAEAIAQQRSDENEQIQSQILTLINSIESAIAGDLTTRAQVGVGEIGTIADFFNAIIESLQILVIDVKNTATQVNQAINHNAIAIENLAGDAQQQANDTQKILETIAAMRGEVKTTSKNAVRAGNMTADITQTATENTAMLTDAIADISHLSDEFAQHRSQTENFSESAQQIQRIINGINQIAMQTNLLAINTGIEAARAGDNHHPSLAILTQEVANLAHRCTTATNEIDAIVQTIHRDTSEINEVINLGINHSHQSINKLADSQNNLQQIVTFCQQIDELVQSISSSMVEAVQYSHQVSQTTTAIVEVSGNTSNTARKIADSLQQTVQLSEQLQTNIRNFQVD